MVEAFEGVTDLGESDKAILLRKELRPEPFVPDQKEWSANNRELINRADTSTGSVVLFTVPSDASLFLTHAWLTGRNLSTLHQEGFLTIEDTDLSDSILGLAFHAQISLTNDRDFSTGSVVSNFSMPIKINNQVTLQSTNSSLTLFGGFTGWLEPKKI